MKRIGILGGTFNPIHIGHLAIAEEAREQLGLDKIIFVPCYLPPHKGSQDVLEARHRFSMVRLAIKGNPRFAISDFEIKKQGKSYSVDTLKHFHLIYPQGTKFFFIVGSDSLPHLHTWRNIRELLKLVTFAVVSRPGEKKQKSEISVQHITMPGLNVSSSLIRKRFGQKKSIRYFVPEKVAQYIEKYQLY